MNKNYRQFVTKSKAGHYTLTLKDNATGIKVGSGYWNSPEEARANGLAALEAALVQLIEKREAYAAARAVK
jgi:hypothetical protein